MDALRLIVEQESFTLALERAENRQAFVVADGCGIVYLPDGSLEMRLPRGRTATMPEADYLRVLKEARTSAASACRDLDEALAQWKIGQGT